MLAPCGTKTINFLIFTGGDIVPSKQQNTQEEQPTNIKNAKPQSQGNKSTENNNAGNGATQTGQQKPPGNEKPPPIPALKPNGQPNAGKSEKKKKNKKKN